MAKLPPLGRLSRRVLPGIDAAGPVSAAHSRVPDAVAPHPTVRAQLVPPSLTQPAPQADQTALVLGPGPAPALGPLPRGESEGALPLAPRTAPHVAPMSIMTSHKPRALRVNHLPTTNRPA